MDALFPMIEEIQGMMHKRYSPEEAMNNILFHYSSPVCFIESNRYMLQRAGLPRLDAFYYTMIPGITRTVMRESFGKKPKLNRLSLMVEFLKALYIGRRVECFYLILLDYHGRLIDAVLMQKGSEESAPFYLRDALCTALTRGARSVVLSHNHPGGTLRPSKADDYCTLSMMNALHAIGLPLLDHVIIAKNRAVSMRGYGAINPLLWSMQSPKSKIVREWLDVDLLTDD